MRRTWLRPLSAGYRTLGDGYDRRQSLNPDAQSELRCLRSAVRIALRVGRYSLSLLVSLPLLVVLGSTVLYTLA